MDGIGERGLQARAQVPAVPDHQQSAFNMSREQAHAAAWGQQMQASGQQAHASARLQQYPDPAAYSQQVTNPGIPFPRPQAPAPLAPHFTHQPTPAISKEQAHAMGISWDVVPEWVSLERAVYVRWSDIGHALSLSSDSQIAAYLISCYQDKANPLATVEAKPETTCSKCGALLSLMCSLCVIQQQQEEQKWQHQQDEQKQDSQQKKQRERAEPKQSRKRQLPLRWQRVEQKTPPLSPPAEDNLEENSEGENSDQDHEHLDRFSVRSDKDNAHLGLDNSHLHKDHEHLGQDNELPDVAVKFEPSGEVEAVDVKSEPKSDSNSDDTIDNVDVLPPELKNVGKSTAGTRCAECDRMFSSLGHLQRHRRMTHSKGAKMSVREGKNLERKRSQKKNRERNRSERKSSEKSRSLESRSADKHSSVGKTDRDRTSDEKTSAEKKRSTERSQGGRETKSSPLCEECNKPFKTVAGLERHIKEAHKEWLHVCEICNKALTTVAKLASHTSRVHASCPQCKHCGKKFSLKSKLKKHMGEAHGETKDIVCTLCHKSFTSRGGLKQHMNIHQGHRPWMCDICGVSFTQVGNLSKHKLIHTGEKAFQCDQCDKAFNRSFHLRRHKLSHTGQKSHMCDVCSMAFTHLHNLKRHKMTHTGIKAYVCDVCQKAFTFLQNLNDHKVLHTGVKNHVCDLCDKAFALGYEMRRHKKMVHKVGVNPKDHPQDYAGGGIRRSGGVGGRGGGGGTAEPKLAPQLPSVTQSLAVVSQPVSDPMLLHQNYMPNVYPAPQQPFGPHDLSVQRVAGHFEPTLRN